MMKNKKFIEPILIKAGSNNLGLGLKLTPPMRDCRVLSEVNYQKLKKAYDELERLREYTGKPEDIETDYLKRIDSLNHIRK